MLTLFAMIQRWVFVVIDAIVVVEAVHAKLDEVLSQPKKLLFLQWANLRAIISLHL
jgi:multidrug efflux pump subunit AcrB